MAEEKFDPARIPAAIAKAEGALHASAYRGYVRWEGVVITAEEVALAKALWRTENYIGLGPEPDEALRAFVEKVEAL